MPYDLCYDFDNQIIRAKISGEVTFGLLREYTIESEKLSKEYNCYHIFADFREAISTFSVIDFYDLPKRHEALLASMDESIIKFKRALMFPKEMVQDERFFENVAVNRGQNVKLFADESAAFAWLKGIPKNSKRSDDADNN